MDSLIFLEIIFLDVTRVIKHVELVAIVQIHAQIVNHIVVLKVIIVCVLKDII